jgi:hypothetical protein
MLNSRFIALLLAGFLAAAPLAACGGTAEVEDCDAEDFAEGDDDCVGVDEDDVLEAEEDDDGGFKIKKSKRR